MPKIVPIILGFLCLTPISLSPAEAANNKCDRTLQSIKASLPKVIVFKVTATNPGAKPPKGRSKQLYITMQGNAAETLMGKEDKLLKISKTTIDSCPQVAMVTFGIDQTDWGKTYGLVNGRVQAFVCREENANPRTLRWGEQICV
jgi:hypothetical protein